MPSAGYSSSPPPPPPPPLPSPPLLPSPPPVHPASPAKPAVPTAPVAFSTSRRFRDLLSRAIDTSADTSLIIVMYGFPITCINNNDRIGSSTG
ncbi:hypothetical protein C5B91_02975 [Haloferax sp. Atlit-10N]|nr:hypothetical protein C5B87_02975 [Haloferax sp. Atlit-16N]RDZ60481.1 hypothetical protein C5B91_02975 [Haloferax sp. Atlit-10N]